MTAARSRRRGGGRRATPAHELPRRWRRVLLAGGVASVLVGGAAGTVVALSYDDVYSVPAETATPNDRVDTAVAALEDRHVYVAPDGRYLMDETSQERLEAHLAEVQDERDVPVYAVVWAPTPYGGFEPTGASEVAAQVAVGLDEEALVVIWQGPGLALDNLAVGNGRKGVVGEGDSARRIAEFADRVGPDDVPDLPSLDVGSDPTAAVILGAGLAGLAYAALVGLLGLARLAFGRTFLIPTPTRGGPR